MTTIRPVAEGDLDRLVDLAREAGVGMTTLPQDPKLLSKRIAGSIASFEADIETVGEQAYLFVMESDKAGIVGCCAIYAAVGLSRPFYSFRVINLTHTSQELNQYEPVRALQMVEEFRGNTEIATLYLSPDWRKDRNGRFLSRCRFLFMADFPERFDQRVMAEMRGNQDEGGHSVFWQSLGQRFINMPFSKADYLTSLGKYQFIADLMPKYPVYVRLLPEAAQAVIGQVHEATRPALKLLEREGFRYEGCVDVFDAGPSVVCPLQEIRTIKDSITAEVSGIERECAGPVYMVSNRRLADARIHRSRARFPATGKVVIESAAAQALGIATGQEVRLALL